MAFPTPIPSRGQAQDVFDPAMEAFLAYLPTFETDVTALAAAMSLNDTTDTSASSVLIGLGAKTFVVTAGKSFQPGMYLIAADAAAPSTNSMVLQITSYAGTSLVTDCKSFRGSGTKTSWIMSLSAQAADIAADVAGATAKATPIDADKFGYWDSVSGLLRSATWENLKTAFKVYFDTVYTTLTTVLSTANSFTKAQRGTPVALTSSAASIAIDLSLANNFTHTTSENTTLAAPSNPVAGQSGIIVITQGATARTLAYNSFWKFQGGVVPTLTATIGAVDTFAYYVESATRATCSLIGDVK